MSETRIRTRIAPSPTGDPHIGTAYIALFNYAFAKSRGGDFILRIEDTDQQRSTPESEAAIFRSLRWLGLPWDEGPDVGGPHGPYRQSERTEIYREHVRRLVASGHAYPCFCTRERLDELRRRQIAAREDPRYDGLCSHLDPAEARRRMEAGEPHVIRLKVPSEGDCIIRERLRGEIRFAWKLVDHQILLKSDGFPTYHLANVVDDHLMGINLVIRGEEWISSLPKHLLLYEAFGWDPPEFIHLPLLRNPDKSKLSKRKNPTSIEYYRAAGYLAEALVNYLGLMAYTLPDEREMFSVAELVETFTPERISLGGPVFDPVKLDWLNGRYLREKFTPDRILERLREWKLNDDFLLRVLPHTQKRLTRLSDFIPMVAFLFADRLEYAVEDLTTKTVDGTLADRLLRIALWELEKIRTWDQQAVRTLLEKLSTTEELKFREVTGLFFVVASGSRVSIPLFDAAELLGKDLFRRRIQYALEKLKTAGFAHQGKRLKALEKEYRENYRD